MKTEFLRSTVNSQNGMSRRCSLALMASLIIIAGFGCKIGTNNEAGVDPTGVYTLVSVDDKPVPCELNHQGRTLTIQSGSFTITADGHCVSKINFSVSQRKVTTREVKATYTQRGPKLTMRWEGAGITRGKVQENTFTMENEGSTFAYRK